MIDRITKIQNKAKSLMWGVHRHSETEYMIAVGHKSYRREVKYFIVDTNSLRVTVLEGNFKNPLNGVLSSEDEVIQVIKGLLKQWFPAKEDL